MRTPDREDLHRAVDDLIQRQRVKLRREGTDKPTWQILPSLWEQLETSTMWAGGGQGGGGFGGRPVISTGVVSLMIEAAQAAAEAALDHVQGSRGSFPANLRAVVAAIPANDSDQIAWWHESVSGWVRRARVELRLDPVRPQWARGVVCPECGADSAQAARDGEQVRTPALAISWARPDGDEHRADDAWTVRAVECRSCGACWWRGPDLDALVADMLAANLTRETMGDVA